MHNNIDDLRYIRSTMERSSKFLSLSGISGVVAGLFALIGAGVAYKILYGGYSFTGNTLLDLSITATLVIILASISGFYLSLIKSKKTGAKFWMPVTFQILKDGGVPMFVGGIFCILLTYYQCYSMIIPSMLAFYGIALINVGAKTYRDIKVLGTCEIALGILAGLFPKYGLLFWATGFGVLHIIYGIFMYRKYDIQPAKDN